MRRIYVLCLATLLSACAAPSAPDISGSWKPLNGYTQSVREIPLNHPFYFQALPIDVTVKSMLARWAKESNTNLVYEHPSDFTLHTNVSQIQQSSLDEALRQVNVIYEPFHLTVQNVSGRGIIVSYLNTGINDVRPVSQIIADNPKPRDHAADKPVNIPSPVATPAPLESAIFTSQATLPNEPATPEIFSVATPAEATPAAINPDPLAPFSLKNP